MNNRRDPRIQQTLNRITDTLETANTATQASFYDFSSQYLKPCLSSISICLSSSCAPCLDFTHERQRQRQRAMVRSQRPEAVFDFYADWDDDPYEYGSETPGEGAANERTGLLSGMTGWGADELDRLLAGRGGAKGSAKETEQPTRQRGMTYGTTKTRNRRDSAGKKTKARVKGELNDPTVVPTSSKFGFLESLPFRFGSRGMRYKPSAANLQEGIGGGAAAEERERTEGEALLEDVDEEGFGDEGVEALLAARKGRARSGTHVSEQSDTSYSSRGDIFPSDEEDDAVMLDDEFAITLARRNTDDNLGGSSNTSIRGGKRKRPSNSRKSTSTRSRGTRTSGASLRRNLSNDSVAESEGDVLYIAQAVDESVEDSLPTEQELRREEELVRLQEEADIQQKRIEARQLAVAKGLVLERDEPTEVEDTEASRVLASPRSISSDPVDPSLPQHRPNR